MHAEDDATKDEEQSIFCDLLRIKKKLSAKRSPENFHDPIKQSDVFRELAKREGIMSLVVILYPWQEGFTVCLRKLFGKDLEAFKLPYSDQHILNFIAEGEIPPAIADIIIMADPPLYYKGCVFAEIKDYRANDYRMPRDLWKYRDECILLRPSIEVIQIYVNTICESDWTDDEKIDLENYFIKVTNQPLKLSPDDEINWLHHKLELRYDFSIERKKLAILMKHNNSEHLEPKFFTIYKNFLQTQMYSTPYDSVKNKSLKSENYSDSESDESDDSEDDEIQSNEDENDCFTGPVRGKLKTKVKNALSNLVFRQVIDVASARRLKYSKFTEEEYSSQDQQTLQKPNDNLSETQSNREKNDKHGTGKTERISAINNIRGKRSNDQAPLRSRDEHQAIPAKRKNIPAQNTSKKVGGSQVSSASMENNGKTPLVKMDEFLCPIPWKDLYAREIILPLEVSQEKASDVVPSKEFVNPAIEASKMTQERLLKVPKFSMIPNLPYVDFLKQLTRFIEPVGNANQVSSQLLSVLSDVVDASMMSDQRIAAQIDSSISEIKIEHSVPKSENNLPVPEKAHVEMNQNIVQPEKNKCKSRSTRTLMSLLLERHSSLATKVNSDYHSSDVAGRSIKTESKPEVEREPNANCEKVSSTGAVSGEINANSASTVGRATSISNLFSPRGIMVLHASAKSRKKNKEPPFIKKSTDSMLNAKDTMPSQIPSTVNLPNKGFKNITTANTAIPVGNKHISKNIEIVPAPPRMPNQAPSGDAASQNMKNPVSVFPSLHRIRLADSTISPRPPLLPISSPRNPLTSAEALTLLRPPPMRNIVPSIRPMRPPNSGSQPRLSTPRNASPLIPARMRLSVPPVVHSVTITPLGVRPIAQNKDITPRNPLKMNAGIRHSYDSSYRPVNQPAILRKRKFSSEINRDISESTSKRSETSTTKLTLQMLKMRYAYNVQHAQRATLSTSPSSSGFVFKDEQVARPVFNSPTSLRMVRHSNPTDSLNFQQVTARSTVAQDVRQFNIPRNLSHLSTAVPINHIQTSIRNVILRPTLMRNTVKSLDQRNLQTYSRVASHASFPSQNVPRASAYVQSGVPKRTTPQKSAAHPFGIASIPSTSS